MPRNTTTGRILHNSFWYGLETILETVVYLGTSVAVARALGPEKLGLYTTVSYPIMVLNTLTGMGMATATRKYMADFLATGSLGMVRAIYRFTFQAQLIAALGMMAIGLAVVFTLMPAAYRTMAALLVLSIVPSLLSWVPAQANMAFEDTAKNTISSLGYIFSYAVVIALSLQFHWDLPGIAAAMLVGRLAEATMRVIPMHRTLRGFPAETLPGEIRLKIRRFCAQAIGAELLVTIVWGRSELFFLTALSSAKQVAFYGLSATIADKLLLVPTIFGTATGISLMGEAARDPKRLDGIIHNAVRMLSLLVFPLALGAAAVSPRMLSVMYGYKYIPAAAALTATVVLVIPKAFQIIPNTLLRAADRQSDLIRCLVIAGVLNVAIDYPLIKFYGAVGAAFGNGIAQAAAVLLLWHAGARQYRYRWPTAATLRLLAAALIASAVAYFASHAFQPLPGLIVAVALAVPVYILLVRLFGALEPDDYPRLNGIAARLPGRLARAARVVLRFAIDYKTVPMGGTTRTLDQES